MEQELLGLEINQMIAYIIANSITQPNVAKALSEYNVEEHAIYRDRGRYPDKPTQRKIVDKDGNVTYVNTTEPITRIGIPRQKEIVDKAVAFLFGTPVRYDNQADETIFEYFSNILKREYQELKDKEIARNCSIFKMCAELWYTEEDPNNVYGFDTKYRLRSTILSPRNNNIYPCFDNDGKMYAFMRKYTIVKSGVTTTYYDIYTASKIIQVRGKDSLEVYNDTINPIGKIPVVFYQYEKNEWQDVQSAIERREEMMMEVAESNKKTAFPILVVQGNIDADPNARKNYGAKLWQTDADGGAQYVQPPTASEAFNSEMQNLEDLIYDGTNTPKLSLDNLSGLGNILASQASAQFYFFRAHLKVSNRSSIYIPNFQRRASVVESFIKQMKTSVTGKLDVTPVITPFVIEDESSLINMLMIANGNQAIYSQKDSMRKAGVENVDNMMKEIQEESKERASNIDSNEL